jgi:hypothetical protein
MTSGGMEAAVEAAVDATGRAAAQVTGDLAGWRRIVFCSGGRDCCSAWEKKTNELVRW